MTSHLVAGVGRRNGRQRLGIELPLCERLDQTRLPDAAAPDNDRLQNRHIDVVDVQHGTQSVE
jgi:hypothetical protein